METVLLISQNFMLFEMFHDVAVHCMFHNFAARRSERDWAVIGWVGPISLLKQGRMWAFFSHLVLNLGALMLEKSPDTRDFVCCIAFILG